VPRAAIDIGSSAIRLLVIDAGGRVIIDSARSLALSNQGGLGEHGLMRPDRVDAALEVLEDFARRAGDAGVPADEVCAVASRSVRQALNVHTFLDRVVALTGLHVRVLSDADEAGLVWMGALGGLGGLPSGPCLVAAPGERALQLALGEHDQVLRADHLDLGATRLTERYLGQRYKPAELARLRETVEAALARVVFPTSPRSLVGCGTFVTMLASLEMGASDPRRTHGYRLTRSALQRWIDRLLFSSPQERSTWADPSTVRVLLASVCVLEAVSRHARKATVVVSTGGLRHGALSARWI